MLLVEVPKDVKRPALLRCGLIGTLDVLNQLCNIGVLGVYAGALECARQKSTSPVF